MVAELEILPDSVLSELKLGKQASRYKIAQKTLLSLHTLFLAKVLTFETNKN
jgi:hypothetical protein